MNNKLEGHISVIKGMEIPDIIVTVMGRLHASGYQAYVVGGAVRDICLHREPADWDVATSATVKSIESIFSDIRTFRLKHGTVTLVHGARHHEITTFRGTRKSKTIKADLGCRDFTINAMAYDTEQKEIFDPYGGQRDILGRTVRAVGKPNDRFEEDPLRLLRAVRLAAELGFRIEPKTFETISLMADELTKISKERIRTELMKILMIRRPSKGLNLMMSSGLLKAVLPELLEGYRKKQNSYHLYTIYRHVMETVDRVEPDPVLRLTALLHDIAKPRVRVKKEGEFRFLGHEKASAGLAENIMRRFKFSNDMIRQVTHLIAHHMIGYHSGWQDGAVRRFIRRVGPENLDYLLSFRRADLVAHGLGNKGVEELSELKKRVDEINTRPLAVKIRDLAIDGHKVMKTLGLSQGPEVGRILQALIEKVTDHPELNTEEKLLALLKDRVINL